MHRFRSRLPACAALLKHVPRELLRGSCFGDPLCTKFTCPRYFYLVANCRKCRGNIQYIEKDCTLWFQSREIAAAAAEAELSRKGDEGEMSSRVQKGRGLLLPFSIGRKGRANLIGDLISRKGGRKKRKRIGKRKRRRSLLRHSACIHSTRTYRRTETYRVEILNSGNKEKFTPLPDF